MISLIATIYSPANRVTGPSSEERALPRPVVEYRTAAERGRDCLFVGDDRVEIGFWLKLSFDRANEAFEAAETFEWSSET